MTEKSDILPALSRHAANLARSEGLCKVKKSEENLIF